MIYGVIFILNLDASKVNTEFIGQEPSFWLVGQVSEVNKSPTDSVGCPNRSKLSPSDSDGRLLDFIGLPSESAGLFSSKMSKKGPTDSDRTRRTPSDVRLESIGIRRSPSKSEKVVGLFGLCFGLLLNFRSPTRTSRVPKDVRSDLFCIFSKSLGLPQIALGLHCTPTDSKMSPSDSLISLFSIFKIHFQVRRTPIGRLTTPIGLRNSEIVQFVLSPTEFLRISDGLRRTSVGLCRTPSDVQ